MKRVGLMAAATIGLTLAAPGIASAHVTATAPDAAPGGYSVVTLRVPTESEKAGTTRLEITLPQDHPLAVVRGASTPGWDISARKTTLPAPIDNGHGGKVADYVSSVTFTAREGISIAPGEFAEFKLLLGPLPDVRTLTLPAIQTYSDGTVVSWIERGVDGTKPDKPAPVVQLTAAKGHDTHDAATKTDPSHTETPAAQADSHKDASNTGSWLGGIALIVALAAAALAALPLVRAARNR
ncbi:YcnI family protein [Nocardia sp. NPDC052566]|uniref:YcnI family protein n=1 Tax=Nocardia sp. NPDC052566 TaxID=3364330 RepID=UPI0037C72517